MLLHNDEPSRGHVSMLLPVQIEHRVHETVLQPPEHPKDAHLELPGRELENHCESSARAGRRRRSEAPESDSHCPELRTPVRLRFAGSTPACYYSIERDR